jgi:IS1 family transposase
MADIISADELMYYNFEPRTKNRFIMYVEGVPAFEIKTTDFPKVTQEVNTLDHINVKRYTKGKTE